MALQFSGGPYVNQTFAGATKQNLIDGIETALLAAGWTTVSGHLTTNLLMQTATSAGTGQGLSGRIRFKDNAGNGIQLSAESSSGLRAHSNDTSGSIHLQPGTAKTFRVLATPYHFFVFTSAPVAAKEFAAGGILYVPPNLQGLVTEAVWLIGNGDRDNNATLYNSWRTVLWTQANWQGICNTSMSSHANDGNTYAGDIALVVPSAAVLSPSAGGAVVYRYHNDDLVQADPLVAWGLTGVSGQESKIKGQLWDAVVVSGNPLVDSVVSIGGHNYWVITYQNWGSANVPRGALLVAIS
jgi:hypothetical protein